MLALMSILAGNAGYDACLYLICWLAMLAGYAAWMSKFRTLAG